MQPLYRYKMLLEKHQNELATTLTTENGKTIDDARAEVRRSIQMVEVACGMPSLMMGDSLNDVSTGIDSHTIRQPLGVCAGITPFNFPSMVPMWMWPFAIAAGNAFILKPSEKVPMTPTLAASCCMMPAFPPGVFNLIHGDKVAVDALLHHPLVRAISFVGSTPVAKYIYKTAAAEGKRVQALGGAKNHLVVMPDAHMPKTVENIISSAFGAAGERCLAGSVLVPVGDAAEPLLKLLVEKTNAMRVGDGIEEGVGMGPLVTKEHRDRVAGYIEKGVDEGAKPMLDGREIEAERRRLLPWTNHLRRREAGDDDREGRDLRTGAFGDSREDAGRSDRAGEQLAVRKRDFDFHRQRKSGARIFGARGGRHGWDQRRRGRAHGLLPVRGLEELVLRRSARARQRRRDVLHRAKSAHDTVVLDGDGSPAGSYRLRRRAAFQSGDSRALGALRWR